MPRTGNEGLCGLFLCAAGLLPPQDADVESTEEGRDGLEETDGTEGVRQVEQNERRDAISLQVHPPLEALLS